MYATACIVFLQTTYAAAGTNKCSKVAKDTALVILLGIQEKPAKLNYRLSSQSFNQNGARATNQFVSSGE